MCVPAYFLPEAYLLHIPSFISFSLSLCAFRFDRLETRLSSLDTLLKQEADFLKIQVAKIVALKPDILVVQRTVSRIAQVCKRAFWFDLIWL